MKLDISSALYKLLPLLFADLGYYVALRSLILASYDIYWLGVLDFIAILASLTWILVALCSSRRTPDL